MKLSRLAAAAAPALLTGLLAACGTADAATPHNVSLPGDGHSHATLQVLTGTAELRVGVANLGGGGPLLRVSTPAADPPPQLRELAGNAVVQLSAKGASAVRSGSPRGRASSCSACRGGFRPG